MSSTRIDPLILQKLQAFSQRRRQLIIRRGLYAAGATLLATMMLVALIDWLFVLPDAARWALSGAAYLTIIVVEWRSCLRLLVSAPGPRKLARLLEHAEPQLREDLLSAVELGEAHPDGVFDSEQFRALVQTDVAARVRRLDIEQLLPMRMLRRPAMIAAGAGLVCLLAFVLTGFQFGTLMMRALLPMANFARVSKVQVKIIEPAPAERRVPQGDTLPLLVELGGRRAHKAMLETFTPSGGREVVPMTPVGPDRFSATIQVGRENVLYRVRAGDALTRKYQLEAVARPAVVAFEKSYTYPAYAKLAPKVVSEENGDLAGLEGSEVMLRLRTNQPVREAELRIEQGKKHLVVPLAAEGGALVARVPLMAAGVYRVHLVGAASGFENKFSPEYELRVEPDLVPQVTLELPKQDLILPSNEIVDVRGSASDDLALAGVAQLVKINEGAWKETPLAGGTGTAAQVERRWDLFEQGVKPGDLVTMKLVATDLKGNKAESRPLQVTITATGFDSKRLQALAGLRELHSMLQAQHGAAATLARQAKEARQQFDRLPEGDAQRRQALLPATATLDELAQKNAAATGQLATALAEALAGHQTGNLALLGHLLARLNMDSMQQARVNYESLAASPDHKFARELNREAHDAIHRVEQRARQAQELCRIFLTAEELDVLNEHLQIVAQEEDRLTGLAHRAGTDAGRWAPVADRLRVALAEMRSLEELTGEMIAHGARGVPDPMRHLQKTLNKHRTTMETALASPASAELLAPTLEMARAIGELARQALAVRRDFRGPAGDGVRELLREAQPSYALFEQLQQETTRLSRNDRIPLEVSRALLAARWASKLGMLKARGDVEEWRPDADAYFISDVRLVTRVVQAVAEQAAEERPEVYGRQLQGIDRAFRVLECGHEIAELLAATMQLGVAERWEIFDPKARTANPQDWTWIGERLKSLPEEIRRALNAQEQRALAEEAHKILREAPGQAFTQAINREMDERFNPARAPLTAREPVEQFAAELQRALALFREPMEEARQALAKLTPSLAETMKQLAKKTGELRDKTTNQAQQAHEKLPEEVKAEARETLAQQDRLNEKVEALKDALRADANQQNILQAEQRERARDADDALAMLKEPPPKAAEDLARAARSEQPAAQEQALQQAAGEQQKLARALEQLAEHYGAMEQGKPEETRTALRATEMENGIKEQLDQQFAKAAELAKMAQSTPEELLAQLEKALPINPQMQQELSGIAQDTLKNAAAQLQQASAQEKAVAQSVQKLAADEQAMAAVQVTPEPAASKPGPPAPPAGSPPALSPAAENPDGKTPQSPPNAAQPANAAPPPNAAPASAPTPSPSAPANPALAQAAQQQTPIAQGAAKAAEEIARAGRHESRMENPIAGEQLQKLGEALQQTAEQRVPGAQEALTKAPQAAQAQPAVEAANSELQRALGQLMAATNPGDPSAAEQPNAPAPGTPPSPAAAPPENQGAPSPKAPGATSPPASASAPPGSAATASSAPSPNAPGSKPASSPAQAGSKKPPAAAPASAGLPKQPASGASSAPTGNPSMSAQSSPRQPGMPTPPSAPGESGMPADPAAGPASPEEQVWMARALDALDAALNASASAPGQNAQTQAGQPPGGPPQPAQASGNTSQSQQSSAAQSPGGQPAPQSNAMAQTQSALTQAAQAAAAAARQARTEAGAPGQQGKPGQPQPGSLQAMSKGGAPAPGDGPSGPLAEARNKAGDWGKLPKQMAEELTQGQREGIAGEYRNQVETYYRAIAEKSKKP